jgi:hypothetical protein
VALKEGRRRAAIIGATSVATLLVFVFVFHGELAKSLSNVPRGSPFGDMVGIVNLPRAIAMFADGLGHLKPGQDAWIEAVLRLCAMGLVVAGGLRLAMRREFRASFSGLSDFDRCWLVLGALLVAGCYLAIQSVGYRGIYLLIVLSAFFPLIRSAGDAEIRRRLVYTALSIVPIMWMEGVRHWMSTSIEYLNFSSFSERLGGSLTWVLREALWINLAQVLVGVIFVFLSKQRHVVLPRMRPRG